MSNKPHSINDLPVASTKIRKDQFRRIRGIIDANRQFPTIALGLVRDYCKGINEVASVQEENGIIYVFTKNQAEINGTVYEFRLVLPKRVETPTI